MLPSLSSTISSRAPAASRLLQQANNSCRRTITNLPSSSSSSSSRASAAVAPSSSPSQPHNHHSTIFFRPISHTSFIQAQMTVNLPSMGDSITEGTIVEWCVQPGSLVREGDVLALVETDKVTVDIKAEQEGVLVKQLGEVEGVVEVGEGLYVLDTDVANATVAAPTAATENTDGSEVNASLDAEKMVAAEPPSTSSTSTRVPSIHFLGKEGWKERRTASDVSSAAAAAPTTTVPTSNRPNDPTTITHIPYSAMYGRPPITDDEMEALMLGGADEAPEVRSVVSEKEGLNGVVFVGGKVVTAGPRGVWLAE